MSSEDQQARRRRDDDSDSMYSDDVPFMTLVTGTIEEQNAAREACDDGDNDSDVSGSVVTSVESWFDVASEPQPPVSTLGITRRRETGFVFGGDMDVVSASTDQLEDGDGNRNPNPEAAADANPDPLSSPASSPEQVHSQTQGPADPPAFPINWAIVEKVAAEEFAL